MQILNVSNASCIINGKAILEDISFTLDTGDLVSVVGPNGAGKSTLIKLIDRLTPLTGGSISIFGRDLANYSRRDLAKIISYVPPQGSMNADFTVKNFVMTGRYPHFKAFKGVSTCDIEKVNRAMELTSIQRIKDVPMEKLGGGEYQRVIIAAALAQGTQIMLLDEPVAFLDPKSSDDIHELLIKLNRQEGISIIMVTNDINYALLIGSKLLGLKGGRLLFFDDGATLAESKGFNYLFDKGFSYVNHPNYPSIQILP